MEKAIDAFVKYQKEAEERFMKYEVDRWRKEVELEDKRRTQEQEHEARMMEMLGRMLGRSTHNYSGMYDFNEDTNYRPGY